MTFEDATTKIKTAKCPEDVFGSLDPRDFLKSLGVEFKRLSVLVHPDKSVASDAAQVFAKLTEWKVQAEWKIQQSKYGDKSAFGTEVWLTSKKSKYRLNGTMAQGDLCDIFSGYDEASNPIIAKVVRSPKNNDLVLNEANVLAKFRDDPELSALPAMVHVPELLDHFQIREGAIRKQVNIFRRSEGFVSLQDVLKMYPEGIPVPDAAWMLNRLLGALIVPHQAKQVHAGIAPSHFLIHPETHNGILIDYCYSVPVGNVVKASSPELSSYIPSEISSKQTVSLGTDLYMASKLFITLVGGEHNIPRHPPYFLGLFRSYLLAQSRRRNDVFDFHEDFNTYLKEIYGPRTYRPLTMTATS